MDANYTGGFILALTLGLTFVSMKSSYWILKSLSSVLWFAMLAYWGSNKPASIVAGSPVDQIIVLFLIFMGIVMFFAPAWYSKDENGIGKFRNLFKSPEDEENEANDRYMPSMQERNSAYAERVRRALSGEITRR